MASNDPNFEKKAADIIPSCRQAGTEPCSYYTFYYSAWHAKGSLPVGKGPLNCGNW